MSGKNILKELDGFRVIAVFLVVSFHLSFYFNAIPGYNTIISTGYLGVQLFFILSSFLLARQFLGMYSAYSDKMVYILTFFKKRIYRIYPLFIFSSIILYVIGYAHPELSVFPIIKYLLFIEDIHINPVMWSLFVEMRFYLILPFIMHVVCNLIIKNKISQVYLFMGSIAAISYIYRFSQLYFYGLEEGYDILYNSFFANIDCLAVGIAGAVFYERNKHIEVNAKTLYFILVSSFAVLFYAMHIKYNELFKHIYIPYAVFSICNIAWTCAIVSLLLLKKSRLNKLFSLNIFVYLSTISYGIYMWHLPVKIYTYEVFSSYNLNGILVLIPPLSTWIITLIVSLVCYKYLELPFLLKTRKVTNKI